ncbi:heat shock protein HtpX [Bacillus sp. THAF10]|uniref:M48 family metallopeptidase n=1 Tax=Bacillus sp. THAF10 TaxID=2587848 RepID=UPI00126815F6|nr:M48 family metallopeptidase [Bacillus sp. THAF10]QFT91136.1 heat shock protein HtpX [Bacillus sp. THAF10]
MTDEKFELLVKKLETKAEENPGRYRFKVLLLTALGYGYILFFLSLVLVLLTISVLYMTDGNFSSGSLKLFLVTGALSFFIIKSLYLTISLPEGYYLKKNEAPELEKAISTISTQLKTPKIHAIVLDNDFNAAVMQHHKFGLFGPKKNILMIGIPLMSGLSREQFTTVLAHELAHISHSDTSFGAMIYRVRKTWAQLMTSLENNEQFGTFLFRKFIQWFYPRYSAHTFVMARQQEYAADAAAAKVTSPEAVRDTLCTVSIGGQYYYENFFHELFQEGSKTNVVPHPYTQFFSRYQKLNPALANEFLQNALSRESNVEDTHPCLTARLNAVGMKPDIPTNKESAIDFFFANPKAILQQFNQEWLEHNKERWNEQIASYNDAKSRLQELEQSKELDIHGKYEKAILTRNLVGYEPAIPLLEEMIVEFSEERVAPAYLALGNIYLHQEDTAQKGERYVKKAMEIDWELKEEALDTLCEYYYHTGNMEAFEETRIQLEAWPTLLKQFEEEASDLNLDDQYMAHDQAPEQVKEIADNLLPHSEIVEAYFIRKVVSVIPERKIYLLGLKVQVPEAIDQDEYTEQLLDKYSEELEIVDNIQFFLLNGNEEFEAKMKEVEGSQILEKSVHKEHVS